MNRQELIERKKAQVQKQLMKWAKKTLGLQAGEQLVFDLSLVYYPVVAQSAKQENKLFAMAVEEYFSYKRVIGAGVREVHFQRLRNGIVSTTERYNPHNSIRTLGDFLAYGKERFKRVKNVGKLTVRNVAMVLDRDNIPFH